MLKNECERQSSSSLVLAYDVLQEIWAPHDALRLRVACFDVIQYFSSQPSLHTMANPWEANPLDITDPIVHLNRSVVFEAEQILHFLA